MFQTEDDTDIGIGITYKTRDGKPLHEVLLRWEAWWSYTLDCIKFTWRRLWGKA
jgi:hypothetical protein